MSDEDKFDVYILVNGNTRFYTVVDGLPDGEIIVSTGNWVKTNKTPEELEEKGFQRNTNRWLSFKTKFEK